LPSQKQLRWSELKVGITVLIASVVLAVLVFLMSGTTGMFTKKFLLITYFDNAEGLRAGQPVDLEGVPVGNVTSVRVVPNRPLAPVQVVMKIKKDWQPFFHKDSKATVKTAGVLGESYIDVDSKKATKATVVDGDEVPSENAPGVEDVVRSSQGTLQNMDVLIRRLDRIVASVESGKGTLGEVINDPTLINKTNAVLNQIQGLLNDVSNGQGTLGQLFKDKTLYRKLDDTVDKLNRIADEAEAGKGNLGKLLKDETLYNNLNQSVTKANKLLDDVNAGKGALGKLTKDEALAAKLQDTINKLSSIADRMEAGEGSVGLLLKNPSLYNNSDQMLIETRSLIKAIRENPKKYLTIRFRVF
jgi:phospholipid/cholesterol/gamma-HCH transport system substrate-binding protein